MATTVTIQLDGMMIPVAAKSADKQGSGVATWKEAACGTITLSTGDGDMIRTIRHGRMPETGQVKFKPLIKDDIVNLLAKCRIFVVSPLPMDNWRFGEQSFPDATQVLDVFHAAEYIQSDIDLACGQNDTAGSQQFQK